MTGERSHDSERSGLPARARLALPAGLLVLGILVLGLRLGPLTGPGGSWATDFGDVYQAAEKVARGHSPYPAQMRFEPIPALGSGYYRYPPPLAELLVPLTVLPSGTASLVWLVIQGAAVIAAVWLATGLARPRSPSPAAPSAGPRRRWSGVDLERLLWCAVAACFYLPAVDALWRGNPDAIIALAAVLVAIGGAAAGLGAAGGTLLRPAAIALVPAALVSDGMSRLVTIIILLGGVVLSFWLVPDAWVHYSIALPNLLGGSVDFATNLAPAAVAAHLGASASAVGAVRTASLLVAVVCIGISILTVRRPGGRLPAAFLGTVAILLLPAALWYRDLVLLLPFSAAAFVGAAAPVRVALVALAAVVSLGLAWPPVVALGAFGLALVTLLALWPRGAALHETTPRGTPDATPEAEPAPS